MIDYRLFYCMFGFQNKISVYSWFSFMWKIGLRCTGSTNNIFHDKTFLSFLTEKCSFIFRRFEMMEPAQEYLRKRLFKSIGNWPKNSRHTLAHSPLLFRGWCVERRRRRGKVCSPRSSSSTSLPFNCATNAKRSKVKICHKKMFDLKS